MTAAHIRRLPLRTTLQGKRIQVLQNSARFNKSALMQIRTSDGGYCRSGASATQVQCRQIEQLREWPRFAHGLNHEVHIGLQ